MLATNDIQRSIARISVDLTRQMDKKRREVAGVSAAEYEIQYQIPIKGSLGGDTGLSAPPAPAELTKDLAFGFLLWGFPGGARRSRLDRPHVRGGFEITTPPDGVVIVPYWYVSKWAQDGRKNFIGATLTIGVAINGSQQAKSTKYEGILHVAFQGYGTLNEGHNATNGFNTDDE